MLESQRLKMIREKLGFQQGEFALSLDVKQGTYSPYESAEREKPIPKSIKYALRKYNVNVDWLETGKGAMFIGKPKAEKGIPYYDIDVSAGNITLFNDHGKELPQNYFSIPPFADCDLAINIYGDSMYPKFRNGDIILCKEIHDWKNFVQFGEVYFVVTHSRHGDSQRFVKFVRKSEKQHHYKMVSENQKHDPFDVAFGDIKKMFIVKGKIERNQI